MVTLMWYATAAVGALLALVMIGRLMARRQVAQAFPAAQLLARERPISVTLVADPALRVAQPIAPHRLRPAPGAPNTDPPTDRHISERGTATIRKRTGRRRSTTGV
jgi:hypothetical protein